MSATGVDVSFKAVLFGRCLASGLPSSRKVSFGFSPKRTSYICEVAAVNFLCFVLCFLDTCFMI